MPGRGWGLVAKRVAGARLGTPWPASYGPPRCRANAICVPDPGRCGGPDDRRGCNTVPGCGRSSRGIRGSRADRIGGGKKRSCRVTTLRRNSWSLNRLGCGLGPLAARPLRLGMAGFDISVLAMFGLSPRRLPAVDLAPAFRLLAVALVPRPRLIPAPAPFAEADPGTRPARPGRRAAPCLTVRSAHGRCHLPREARGGRANVLPGRHQDANETLARQSMAFRGNETENKTA